MGGSLSEVSGTVGSGPWFRHRGTLAAGAAAIGSATTLFVLSDAWNKGWLDKDSARWLLVAVLVLAGAVHLVGLAAARRSASSRGDLICVGVVGLLSRFILVPSEPLFVSDFYRYLWDGAVTASGMNPYRYSPETVLNGLQDNSIPPELSQLAGEAGKTLHRINHPYLTTIYPPVAQVVFAAAYLLKPWSLEALRLVLFLFDAATFLLLTTILRYIGRPIHAAAWYWWNPLLLRESVHSAHMDVVLLPLLLAALLLSARRNRLLAAIALALATAVKIWPVILLPLTVRRVARSRTARSSHGGRKTHVSVLGRGERKVDLETSGYSAATRPSSRVQAITRRHADSRDRLTVPPRERLRLPLAVRHSADCGHQSGILVAFIAMSLLLWAPAWSVLGGSGDGFTAYARGWESNAGVFRAFSFTFERIGDWTGLSLSGAAARGFVFLVVLAVAIWQGTRPAHQADTLFRRALVVVAVLFILSPTQFPWYYTWMLPLLALSPFWPLLAYTVLLPLYYLHYQYEWLVWIEHVPILVWSAISLRGLTPSASRRTPYTPSHS